MILHSVLLLAGTIAGPAIPVHPVHSFYDKPAKLELTLAVSAASFDMAQTCHNLARGGVEYTLTQNCAADVGITAGILGLQELLALGLHKTGHHRLERLARLWSTPNNVQGIISSKKHGAW